MGKMKVSNAIIRRLPRYRRYLGYLQTKGIKKISSNELSEMIQAITNYTYYYKIGFNIIGLFDANPKIVGNVINDVEVMDVADLEEYCKREKIDIGIICVNRENAQKVADSLVSGGVKGIWNFAPIDLEIPEGIALESVHLSDSLHALSFMIKRMNEDKD